MRLVALLFLSLSLFSLGCGCSGPAAHEPSQSTETPEPVAARIFDRAQSLEKEHQTKQAFTAYHQVARNYPETLQGKKAAERIWQARQQAIREVAARKKR